MPGFDYRCRESDLIDHHRSSSIVIDHARQKTQKTTFFFINKPAPSLSFLFLSGMTGWSPQDTETPPLTGKVVSSREKAVTLAATPVTPLINTFTGEHILPFDDCKTVREARQRRVAQVLGVSPISSVPEASNPITRRDSGAVTQSPKEQTTCTCASMQVRYDLRQGIMSLLSCRRYHAHALGLVLLTHSRLQFGIPLLRAYRRRLISTRTAFTRISQRNMSMAM